MKKKFLSTTILATALATVAILPMTTSLAGPFNQPVNCYLKMCQGPSKICKHMYGKNYYAEVRVLKRRTCNLKGGTIAPIP